MVTRAKPFGYDGPLAVLWTACVLLKAREIDIYRTMRGRLIGNMLAVVGVGEREVWVSIP